MKTFVIHYSKLTDRKQSILSQFALHGIKNYEFVENYNKEELTDSDYNRFETNMKPSGISVSLKNFWVFDEIAAKYEHALIFEDDVILSPGFSGKLDMYVRELPPDWDMLFIGDGCNFHIPKNSLIPFRYIYKKGTEPTLWGGMGATRCVDSYLVSKKAALALSEYIRNIRSKITVPIDWLINTIARDCSMNVYWAEPTIVTQGTEGGLFESSHDKGFVPI